MVKNRGKISDFGKKCLAKRGINPKVRAPRQKRLF